MVQENKQILRVLVGSHAHGLATSTSDKDYRGVYVARTSDLLRLSERPPKSVSWVEGETEDDTNYELGHFLHLATKSNPSILEVFGAPIDDATPEGEKLRQLLPYVWSTKGVLDAFIGYAHSQRKKMFDEKWENNERRWKYAVAHIRVLWQGVTLFQTGEMVSRVPPTLQATLRSIKAGERSMGEVVDLSQRYNKLFVQEYNKTEKREPDMEKINEFLLTVRKENW